MSVVIASQKPVTVETRYSKVPGAATFVYFSQMFPTSGADLYDRCCEEPRMDFTLMVAFTILEFTITMFCGTAAYTPSILGVCFISTHTVLWLGDSYGQYTRADGELGLLSAAATTQMQVDVGIIFPPFSAF